MPAEAADWKGLFPFRPHYLELSPQLRLHYVDEGPLDTTDSAERAVSSESNRTCEPTVPGAPCIVAIHGNPTWSFYYRAIVHRFRTTHRVLAIDHIGCGLSDKPQKYPYSLRQHTENLVRWIDALDLARIVLVVHDWGGAIGLGAALQRRDRIAGLVVLNTGAFPPPYVPLRIAACRFPLVGSFAVRSLNGFAVAATRMAIDRLPRLDPAVQAGLLAPYDSYANRVGVDSFVRDIPLTKKHPTYQVLKQLESRLPELSHLPIQLVWGMKDWCFRPECLRRFQKLWPKANVNELADVGHYVMEESPEAVQSAIEKLLG